MTTYPDLAPAGAAPAPAVSSARVEWAAVPRVDLLPPEIQQGRRLAALKRVLAGAVAATVVVCVGGVAWAQAGVGSAQDDLDAAQARGATLRAQQVTYAQVPKVLALIDAAGAAREQAMGKDILWYGLLSDLSLTTPEGVKLDSLTVGLDTSGTQAPVTDPLGAGRHRRGRLHRQGRALPRRRRMARVGGRPARPRRLDAAERQLDDGPGERRRLHVDDQGDGHRADAPLRPEGPLTC